MNKVRGLAFQICLAAVVTLAVITSVFSLLLLETPVVKTAAVLILFVLFFLAGLQVCRAISEADRGPE